MSTRFSPGRLAALSAEGARLLDRSGASDAGATGDGHHRPGAGGRRRGAARPGLRARPSHPFLVEAPQALEAALAPRSEVRRALERAARNIAKAHASRPRSEVEIEPGVLVGRRPDPLGRVGVYAPGGRAAYPSSVLMGVVPARVAGVGEVVVCSPPGPDGLPAAGVLAAAALAGADRVFAVGGAGAVAAMAYGTQRCRASIASWARAMHTWPRPSCRWSTRWPSIRPPDPVRSWSSRTVGHPRGRGSRAARPGRARSGCLLRHRGGGVTVAEPAAAVERAAAKRGAPSSRRRSRARGAVLSVDSLDEAWPFVSDFAPEHLLIATAKPHEHLASRPQRGTVFLGERASVAFGDYMTGANHVLPTAGLARTLLGPVGARLLPLDHLAARGAQARRSASRRTWAGSRTARDSAHAAAARAWRKP